MKSSLALVAGGLGCYAIASQVSFVSEFLAIFSGNELCLGIIFACWFVGIASGAGIGGRLARRSNAGLVIVCGLMLSGLPVLLTLTRMWRGILSVPAGEIPGLGMLLLSGLVLITPFALLIGLSFPLVCRVAARSDNPLTIGRVYVIESAGAILGGLAMGVILAGRVAPFEAVAIAAAPLLGGLSWFCLTNLAGLSARVLGGTFSLILLAVLALSLTGKLADLDHAAAGVRFDDLKTGSQRIAWSDSPYQHLDLAKRGGQYSLFADGKVAAVFPDRYADPLRSHLVMTQHPGPRRLLVLGTASFGFLRSALFHPLEKIDWVELDQDVIGLARPFLDQSHRQALDDKRVQLHLNDGRRFVEQSDESWDLVFSDAPDPSTASLNRFYTTEFFEQVRKRLSPGGVFVTRLSSSVNFLGGDTASLIRTIQHTLRQTFGQVLVVPGGETFFVASDAEGILLDDPELLGSRYQDLNIKDPGFTRHHFKVMFQAGQVDDLQDQLRTRGQARINSDYQPVTYLQNVMRWSRLSGDGAAGFLRLVLQVPFWAWLLLVLVVLGGLAALSIRHGVNQKSRHAGAVTAIGVVGAAGLAIELVITYSYQAHFGSLYRELGLIVAAFMTGLALGGFWINRRLALKPGSSLLLGVLLLGLAVFCALLPGLLSTALMGALPRFVGQLYLLLLVLTTGACTGAVFPLAAYLSVSSGRPMARSAGSLDAVDHWGAAIGAFLTGIVLAPALGHFYTCMLLTLSLLLTGIHNLLLHRSPDVLKS